MNSENVHSSSVTESRSVVTGKSGGTKERDGSAHYLDLVMYIDRSKLSKLHTKKFLHLWYMKTTKSDLVYPEPSMSPEVKARIPTMPT